MEEAETTEKEENSGLKAKTVSLCAKILGAVIIVAGHILKWTNVFPEASSTEICACGFSVMGIFGTVDLNIMLDKFTGRE